MRAILCLGLLSVLGCAPRLPEGPLTGEGSVSSPDGRIEVEFRLGGQGEPRYLVRVSGAPALEESRLGLVRDDGDFSTGLRRRAVSAATPVTDRYEILTAKRRQNVYRANRRVFQLETGDGRRMDVVFQVSNDGVAFRYVFPDTSVAERRIVEEVTSYRFLPGTRAWLQPMQQAITMWGTSNVYEEFYQKEIPVGTPSTLGAGWAYPALFHSAGEAGGEEGTWLLVSETGLRRNWAGTRLRHESPGGEYSVGMPDPRERRDEGGAVNPTSALPWSSPWRLIAVGTLRTVAESMLGIDLADPPAVAVTGEIVPGKASWSWPLLGDRQTVLETQKQFVDYAASMGWRYCLVDALWDTQIGWDGIRELVEYATPRNVRILLWYHSAGTFNTMTPTPRDRMLTRESRRAEFERLRQIGVAGVKVDFFGADGQSMIAYYHDIMTDAAPYGLLLNFHGATIPRGWSRTYPHLMTMEAVKGLEFVNFGQANADAMPVHATILPFTRNVFDPMDFTPMVLDRLPRMQRKTTAAAELAQSVLFTSGITHYAETPAGMAKGPEYVREFLRAVPSVWDDIRFQGGYPGKYVVLARRSGEQWWVAGVNGEDSDRALTLQLGGLGDEGPVTLITDGDDGLGFQRQEVELPGSGELKVVLKARGGFVARMRIR